MNSSTPTAQLYYHPDADPDGYEPDSFVRLPLALINQLATGRKRHRLMPAAALALLADGLSGETSRPANGCRGGCWSDDYVLPGEPANDSFASFAKPALARGQRGRRSGGI